MPQAREFTRSFDAFQRAVLTYDVLSDRQQAGADYSAYEEKTRSRLHRDPSGFAVGPILSGKRFIYAARW